MNGSNNEQSREAKRKAVAVLFSLSPKPDAAAPMEAYIQAAARIPPELYQAAIQQLIETWTWPNPPQPGDILRVAKQIHGARRIQAREEKQRREQAEMVADAMTSGQARELLENLQAQPEPTTKEQRAARELQMRLLAVAAVRGGGPKLVKAEAS